MTACRRREHLVRDAVVQTARRAAAYAMTPTLMILRGACLAFILVTAHLIPCCASGGIPAAGDVRARQLLQLQRGGALFLRSWKAGKQKAASFLALYPVKEVICNKYPGLVVYPHAQHKFTFKGGPVRSLHDSTFPPPRPAQLRFCQPCILACSEWK